MMMSLTKESVFSQQAKGIAKPKAEVTFRKKKKKTHMEFYSELLGRRVEKSIIPLYRKKRLEGRKEREIY